MAALSGKETNQSGNTAGGHIAGGDVNEVDGDQIVFNGDVNILPPPTRPETQLGRLFRKLKEEAAGDQMLTDYIEQLQIYTRAVDVEEVIGLDGKLSLAGRLDQLDMAKRLKEIVYGQLRQNMFSKTFQTIYATLMAKIFESFEVWVRPAILAGATRQEVDHLVHAHVVSPIVQELETCEEYDGVAIQTVRGMIYFLTGNCHLVWH